MLVVDILADEAEDLEWKLVDMWHVASMPAKKGVGWMDEEDTFSKISW